MPMIKAISAHLQGRHIGYVFEGRKDGHLSTRQVQRIIDEIAQRAGLQKESLVKQRNRKRINQHMLRYSAARWWLDCGIHIGEVARQLGLSCLQIDGRYIEKHHNHQKTSFERAEIYEPLMFKTKERLNEFSGDEDRLNELRQAKIKEDTKNDAEQDILAELKNSWSKISYED